MWTYTLVFESYLVAFCLKLTMSGTRLGKLWDFYHKGDAQNSKHFKCYCRGCVAVKLALQPTENSPEQCFQDGQMENHTQQPFQWHQIQAYASLENNRRGGGGSYGAGHGPSTRRQAAG